MPNTFYTVEAANLFCGDHDPANSKHLTLTEITLPGFEEEFTDHKPGGSRVGIKVAVSINALSAKFKLTGIDPDTMVQFGLSSPIRHVYTVYGAVKDRRTGRSLEIKAIMEARLGKVEGEAIKRGELTGYDYELNEILRYEFYFDTREKFYWDFFTSEFRVDGVEQNAVENQILRIT